MSNIFYNHFSPDFRITIIHDTQNEIMEIFRSLANDGKCVILVSHSPEVAKMCDEVYQLQRISGKKK